jgi:hypothetical protein
MHNLVLETTRLGIEVKNLKMRVESMSSRLDFDERRARALEGVVQYRPGAVPPLQPPTSAAGGTERPLTEAEQAERRSRRRRRRGRRRPADAHATGQGFGAAGPADAPHATGQGFGAAGSSDAPQGNRGGFGETSPADAPRDSRESFGDSSSADGPRESRGSVGATTPADSGGGSHES